MRTSPVNSIRDASPRSAVGVSNRGLGVDKHEINPWDWNRKLARLRELFKTCNRGELKAAC